MFAGDGPPSAVPDLVGGFRIKTRKMYYDLLPPVNKRGFLELGSPNPASSDGTFPHDWKQAAVMRSSNSLRIG